MIPAAPFVSAVTVQPPAAFSSTASAYRLTQSRSSSPDRCQGRFRAMIAQVLQHGGARLHVQAAGQGCRSRACRVRPQPCIARQITVGRRGISASLRHAFVVEHDLAIVLPLFLAHRQEFVAAAEWMRQRRGIGDDAIVSRLRRR